MASEQQRQSNKVIDQSQPITFISDNSNKSLWQTGTQKGVAESNLSLKVLESNSENNVCIVRVSNYAGKSIYEGEGLAHLPEAISRLIIESPPLDMKLELEYIYHTEITIKSILSTCMLFYTSHSFEGEEKRIDLEEYALSARAEQSAYVLDSSLTISSYPFKKSVGLLFYFFMHQTLPPPPSSLLVIMMIIMYMSVL
jgi:hypothetical protein